MSRSKHKLMKSFNRIEADENVKREEGAVCKRKSREQRLQFVISNWI